MNALSPFADEARSFAPCPADLAMIELRETPAAVSLARIAAVARKEVAAFDRPDKTSPYRAAFNVCLDAYVLARDALDDLIFLACVSHDLDRRQMLSTGELIDILSKEPRT